MKFMKVCMAALIVSLLFAGCGQSGTSGQTAASGRSISAAGSGTEDSSNSASQTEPRSEETVSEKNAESAKTSGETTASSSSAAVLEKSGYPAFDFTKKSVTLNSGYEMPILGLGMFSLSDSEAENSTYWALKAGLRLIDTARIYGNEAAVGRGLQRAINEGIVTREEVFITTKMWTSDFDNGDAAVDASLARLGVDHIDLMILHHSQPSNDVDAYKAMERAVAAGKLRSIGLSNYY